MSNISSVSNTSSRGKMSSMSSGSKANNKNKISNGSTTPSQKKGQVAIKTMIALGILLFTFILSYMVYSQQQQEILTRQRNMNEKNDCFTVSNAIFSAFVLGDGTTLTIDIKHTLSLEQISQRISGEHTFCTISISSLENETYTLLPGEVTIYNRQGIIGVRA